MMNGTGNMADGIGWGMGFGGLFMILFWSIVILGVLVAAKWIFGSNASSRGTKSTNALDILQERYARGEIDEQEYQQKRRELEQ